MSFLTELKRRNVFKVGFAYGVVAWLVMQVSSTAAPALNLPEWTTSLITFLLVLGFPVTLILAWAFEMTPQGIRPTQAGSIEADVAALTSRRLDFGIIALLGAAVIFLVMDNYVLDDDAATVVEAPTIPVVEEAPTEVEPVPAPVITKAQAVMANSVAVLPFENLSVDPDNAFFAAGIHEETLNQLTKLHNLSVISRTSVLRYEESDLSIPEIASELSVGAVMEGSVRYADNKVRITAQLIDAATDEHLWSEVYERDFADIFAIQSDIAMNIANALEAEFSLEEQAEIEKIPTDSPEAYQLYLEALGTGNPARRMPLLAKAIELDPNFAHAYALRAYSITGVLPRFFAAPNGGPNVVAEREGEALLDINRALLIDPNLVTAHIALARIHAYNWRESEAREAFEQALRLSPNDARSLSEYAGFISKSGAHSEAINMMLRALELDPDSGHYNISEAYDQAGDLDAAAEAYRKALEQGPTVPIYPTQLSLVELKRGNLDEVEKLLPQAERVIDRNMSVGTGVGNMLPQLAYVYLQLERPGDVKRLLNKFEDVATQRTQSAVTWLVASLARGDEAQALEWLKKAAEKAPYEGYILTFRVKRNVFASPILDKPEFVALREQLGFTDL